MEKKSFRRGLSLLLSLLMVASLFTVCSIATVNAAGEIKIPMKTWNVDDLAMAAGAEGVRNSHGYPIFAPVDGMIGRRSQAESSDSFAEMYIPQNHPNGTPWIYQGAVTTLAVRLLAEGEFTEGVLAQIVVEYGESADDDLHFKTFEIDFETYHAQPTLVDEVDGYEYKEFYFTCDFSDFVDYEDRNQGVEVALFDRHEIANLAVYSVKMLDEHSDIVWNCSGADWFNVPGARLDSDFVMIQDGRMDAIVSCAGTADDPSMPLPAVLYGRYNADGFNKKEVCLLQQKMGQNLSAGTYSLEFLQSTRRNLGEMKCRYEVVAGTEVLADLTLKKSDIDATVGSDSGAWEIRTLEFTVDETHANQDITFKVYIYNQTDYMLRSAALDLVVDGEDDKPAATKAVCDAISAIGEVTEGNYTEKLAAIEFAEAAVSAYVAAYGEEAISDITNADALTAARQAYDGFNTAEIFYGDIDGNGSVDAGDALKALQHAVKLITLEGTDATAADVDGNGSIDAADALLVLQHTVKVIDTFPVEKLK